MNPVLKTINIILIVLALLMLVFFIIRCILNGFSDLTKSSRNQGSTKRGTVFEPADFR